MVIFERSKHESNECNCEEKFLFDIFFFFFFFTNSIKRIEEYRRMEEGEARRIRFVSCLFENPYFLCTYTNAYSNGSLNLARVKMQSTTHDLEREREKMEEIEGSTRIFKDEKKLVGC